MIDMTPAERLGEAQALSESRLLREMLDTLERNAIDACVGTNDAEIRHARALEVRVIRSLRDHVQIILAEESAPRRISPV
jgi:hypothetical protein